jgi:hypothetical protein
MGASLALAAQGDYANHDFYGDALEQSFYCKLFSSLGNHDRFEYITPRYHYHPTRMGRPRLGDPTTTKSAALLKAQAFSALANNGATRFYDDAYPDGAFSRRVYERMGEAFGEIERYEPELGGEPCQDVAIYINFESGIDLSAAGQSPAEWHDPPDPFFAWEIPPQSAITAAKSLQEAHVPFGVITKKNLADLSQHRVIVLPNLVMLDEEEAAAFTRFVEAGGGIYASKLTSLMGKDGNTRDDFLLAELLGVSYRGETESQFTHIAPRDEWSDLFPEYSQRDPVSVHGSQVECGVHEGSQVLATITFPYHNPDRPDCYGQIHVNSPHTSTDLPAIVLSARGRGRAIYSAGVLEGLQFESQRRVFINLIKLLAGRPFSLEADAPKCVEILLFHQPRRKRYVINLLNYQADLPNVPVEGIRVRVDLDGNRCAGVSQLPGGEALSHQTRDGLVAFEAPRLETFMMVAVNYK